jgi:hypothetical protein
MATGKFCGTWINQYDLMPVKSSHQSKVEGNYTIESLSEELIELKKVAEDFSRLRHKYEN